MIVPEYVRDEYQHMYIQLIYSLYYLHLSNLNTIQIKENERRTKMKNLRLNKLIEKFDFYLLLVVKRGNISHEMDMYNSIHHEQTLPRANIHCVCVLQLFI